MKSLPKKEKIKKMKDEDLLLAKEKGLERDVIKQESLISRLLVKTRIRAPTKKQMVKRKKDALKGD